MIRYIFLGAGAGLVSALLFAVVATGSPTGLLLCYAAPLPIIIASLGWSHLVGLLGVAVGGIAISLSLTSAAGFAFAIGPALPAWALSYALLGGFGAVRDGTLALPEGQAPGAYPPGYLLVLVALLGAAVALISAVGLGGGDFPDYQRTLRGVAESLLRTETGTARPTDLPTLAGVQPRDIVSLLVRIAPGVAAAIFSLALALNLWLGAKAVGLSGRLPRPWPPVPETRMPPAALGAAVVGLALLFVPGFVGVGGMTLLGALTMAFGLQGLALLHHVTRGRRARGPLLTFAYLLTIFFGGTFLLMALAGMADTATPLRSRLLVRAAKTPPPPSRKT